MNASIDRSDRLSVGQISVDRLRWSVLRARRSIDIVENHFARSKTDQITLSSLCSVVRCFLLQHAGLFVVLVFVVADQRLFVGSEHFVVVVEGNRTDRLNVDLVRRRTEDTMVEENLQVQIVRIVLDGVAVQMAAGVDQEEDFRFAQLVEKGLFRRALQIGELNQVIVAIVRVNRLALDGRVFVIRGLAGLVRVQTGAGEEQTLVALRDMNEAEEKMILLFVSRGQGEHCHRQRNQRGVEIPA